MIIYPKDVQRITGRSYRHSLRVLKKIRETFQKDEHHLVSIHDFCKYTGLEMEYVVQFLSM